MTRRCRLTITARRRFLGEAGVALLQENGEEWVLRMAFEGVTGSHYSSTLFTLWRAYLLREQLGDKFGELVNVMVLWSALRRAAIRDAGYYADDSKLAAYRTTSVSKIRARQAKTISHPVAAGGNSSDGVW